VDGSLTGLADCASSPKRFYNRGFDATSVSDTRLWEIIALGDAGEVQREEPPAAVGSTTDTGTSTSTGTDAGTPTRATATPARYSVKSLSTGRCLAIPTPRGGGGGGDGEVGLVAACDPANTLQQWVLGSKSTGGSTGGGSKGGGGITIKSKVDGLCLLSTITTSVGSCTDVHAATWTLGGADKQRLVASGQCLSVSNYSG
jgi:hypothetical protein